MTNTTQSNQNAIMKTKLYRIQLYKMKEGSTNKLKKPALLEIYMIHKIIIINIVQAFNAKEAINKVIATLGRITNH